MVKWRVRLLAASLLLAGLHASPRAQSSGSFGNDPFDQPLDTMDRPTPVVAAQLRFRLITEIALPGPLPSGGPWMIDGVVEVPVHGGIARVPPEADAVVVIAAEPLDGFPDEPPWAISENGRRRYRTLEDGRVLSERRCDRCKRGWKKRWRLRLPGNALAPPLLHEHRVFFGAMDNLVYCVKAKNGHQLWTTDIGGRSSRRIVALQGGVGSAIGSALAPRHSAILVVPDDGVNLFALDRQTGQRVARVALQVGEGTLIGVPAVTRDGRIVVAHQKYAESEAALMVYRLEHPDGPSSFPPPGLPEPDPEPAAPAVASD